MGARAEALANQFEAKAAEMTKVLEALTDADWKKVTPGEKWSVGVAAHHVAGSHEAIARIVKAIAGGQAMPEFTAAMLDDMNAQHAREHAGCTKPETLELHRKGVAAAAGVVRGLSDAELDRSGTVLKGRPPMSTQQVVEAILINHIAEHMDSIRNTAKA